MVIILRSLKGRVGSVLWRQLKNKGVSKQGENEHNETHTNVTHLSVLLFGTDQFTKRILAQVNGNKNCERKAEKNCNEEN